ncbi:hypothetical protein EYF80_051801 [Liparis tanakae]|uniref:Uncharacterized protein n=1 Tax=Liparis tanakae TaxID=230148 RepID=A0A4Z2FB49_9TELE|nr:hypothetical protein EYF80_051801 [Liparis tanakae]
MAQDTSCRANLSRKACCRVCTTSGITASMRDSDSIGRPSKTADTVEFMHMLYEEGMWADKGHVAENRKRNKAGGGAVSDATIMYMFSLGEEWWMVTDSQDHRKEPS